MSFVQFIRDAYGEDPEGYVGDIGDLETLRAGAVHASRDLSGVALLKRYAAQLTALKSRFPLEEGGACGVTFSWIDPWSETVHGWADVDFELASVLWNVGALHTELGATTNRQTPDGMKVLHWNTCQIGGRRVTFYV
jgi:hypothetical protein